jgi:hypothetical protein
VPLSALLAQSWLQLLWTVFIGATVLSALEVRIGTAWLCVVLAVGHVVPTLAVDGWAMWAQDAAVLSGADVGPSCLVGAGVAGLAVAARSRLLSLLVLGSFGGDAVINSAATVAEHVISTVPACGVIAVRGYAPGGWAAAQGRCAGVPAGERDRGAARRAGLVRPVAALRPRRPATSGAVRVGGGGWRQD